MPSVFFPNVGPDGGFEVEADSPEHRALLLAGHQPGEQPHADDAGDSEQPDRSKAKKPELEKEAASRDLEVTGSGKDGAITQKDLVAALDADDAIKAHEYSDVNSDYLEAEAKRRELTVEGTGKDGAVVKADLVAALEQHDQEQSA